jgi:hypothetical protein
MEGGSAQRRLSRPRQSDEAAGLDALQQFKAKTFGLPLLEESLLAAEAHFRPGWQSGPRFSPAQPS